MGPQFDEAFRAEGRAHAARYVGSTPRRAAWEVLITALLAVACAGAFPSLAGFASAGVRTLVAGPASARAVLEVVVALVAAGLVALVQSATFVRAFLVHHDILHGALFASRPARLASALLMGTLACTASSVWKREHDRHHRDSNHLDRDQDGQTAAWTVARFVSAPAWQQWAYAALTSPWVFYTLAPFAYFFGFMRVKARWYENVLTAGLLALVVGSGRGAYFVSTFFVAASFGFYLFHLQHTFPGVYRRRGAEWDPFDNAILGSSCLELPGGPVVGTVLRWFSYGVEHHHVHHLHPRIPGYRTARCHADGARFFARSPRVTLAGGLRTVWTALYDEQTGALVSVREARALARAG